MTKKTWILLTCIVLALTLGLSGTLAYLTDTDADINTMTLGNVQIVQNEQERVKDAAGKPTNVLDQFTQNQTAFPAVGKIDWAEEGLPVNGKEYKVFSDDLKNVIDKIVTVTNTGKSEAYVRTIVALEAPDYDPKDLIHINVNSSTGLTKTGWTRVDIEDVNYVYSVFTYSEALKPGETSTPSLLQVFLDSTATNEDCAAFGETWDILVISQAVQAAGFADPAAALNEAFGEADKDNTAEWMGSIGEEGSDYQIGSPDGEKNDTNNPPVIVTTVTPDNFDSIDFNAPGQTFGLSGEFGEVTIPELGKDSVISFENATVGALTIADDATLEGAATIDKIVVVRNSTEPITVTLRDANFNVTSEITVKNTDGKSVLNIEDSRIKTGTIYVGEHVNNYKNALAELNITNSYVSCEENNLGSTISVWGRSGVKAKIYDSEIYTYSRGWHQSEDANDNAITFQGAKNIDVDIQRSNMHLYGARSIIYARKYGNEDTTFNTKIENSLIWVVTKSNHNEETLPVWGFNDIKDSILLFTKNVHQSTPAVFKSFVYGNPTIYGNYHVTTQCQWDAPIVLADGQTVTFASDADVSIYDGAGKVAFVKNGSAEVAVEQGAKLVNITIQ